MLGSRNAIALGFLAVGSLSLAFGPGPQHKAPKKTVPFSSIAGIVAKNCVMCHSGPKPKHGLDLTSYKNLMKGDKEGKVVIAGQPGQSRLSKAVHRSGAAAMPPMNPLAPAEVVKVDAWIKAGAKEK